MCNNCFLFRYYFMKKCFLFGLLVSLFVFTWCGIRYQLVDNPIEFNTLTFVDANNEDAGYIMVEYDWKFYAPYGTLQWIMKKDDVGDCIWYIVQDWVKIEDTLVCLLVSDVENNYLAEIDTVGFMSQPIFFRAIDTANMEIFTPSYIGDLWYEFWQ